MPMWLFHAFKFAVILLILDCGSSDLTIMKVLTRGGPECVQTQGIANDHHRIQAYMYVTNPFSDKKPYIMTRPSHPVSELFDEAYFALTTLYLFFYSKRT